MTYSMTAYASRDIQLSKAMARWEIRSVNHRYLELNFKLPAFLGDLEYRLRDIIRKGLARGKIDCLLKLEFIEENGNKLQIDFNLAEELISLGQEVATRFSLPPIFSLFDILRWPSVVKMNENDLSQFNEPLQESFILALQDLIEAREREGLKLKICIEERIVKMLEILDEIKRALPQIQKAYYLKFQEKLNVLKLEFDKDRIEQALASLIQKMDISEELDRLRVHLIEVQRILTVEKTVGKRLDFLMQELNRETNTLASKTTDNFVIQNSIALKVLIEEMREQIQNLE